MTLGDADEAWWFRWSFVMHMKIGDAVEAPDEAWNHADRT